MTHQSEDMQGNAKNSWILKIIGSRNGLENSDWALILTRFRGKNFFRGPVEKFLRVLWACSRYLEGPLRLVLYASKKKKIKVIRRTNPKISTKTWKKKPFVCYFPLDHCSWKQWFSQQIMKIHVYLCDSLIQVLIKLKIIFMNIMMIQTFVDILKFSRLCFKHRTSYSLKYW